MIRAGLTGGYATGKTFVASEFARLGCEVIHADTLGHVVLEPDGEAYRPVVEQFGDGILDHSRRIDRRKLASIVFGSTDRLTELERIVHPAVFRKEEELSRAFALRRPEGVLIYEAAILIETGHYKQYDRVILTVASSETQIQRGMHRDAASEQEVRARIARQWSEDEKRKFADFIIDTSGTKEETVRQVQRVFMELKRLAAQGER